MKKTYKNVFFFGPSFFDPFFDPFEHYKQLNNIINLLFKTEGPKKTQK